MNNNLVLSYTPFYIKDNFCIINEQWFYKQSQILQNDLMDNLIAMAYDFDKNNNIEHIDVQYFEIPHDFTDNTTSIYYAFLKIYKRQYIFDNYMHLFNEYYQINTCNDHINYIMFENKKEYKHYGKIYDCTCCNNYYIIPECTIIYLNDNMLTSLINLHMISKKKFNPNNLQLISNELINTINEVLHFYTDYGAFVKTSLKSAKKK